MTAGRQTPEELETLLEDALLMHDAAALAQLFEDAGVLVTSHGQPIRGPGQIARAARLDRALEIFQSLPLPPWADRARAELSRLGLRPPAPLTLTATEERVAALAASGQTNRQVAQALVVSTRTVEANLARVYRKLGIASRAELGAAMARERVSPRSLPQARGTRPAGPGNEALIHVARELPACGNSRFLRSPELLPSC